MSRTPRTLSESGIYHIMFRGTNKSAIFLNNKDYEKLLETLFTIKQSIPFDLYAYCLMSNHAHFVVKEKEIGDISKIMHRLLTKYARWFNIKYDRTGALLEGRYKSKPVDNDEYFLHLIRYVHQNPKKAGLVTELADYKWSSYGDYLNENNTSVNKDFVFEMLPYSEFQEFHGENEEWEYELFDSEKLSDYDLLNMLKQQGINSSEELLALKYTNPDRFNDIICQLRKKFSYRHIERVTGISRYNLK